MDELLAKEEVSISIPLNDGNIPGLLKEPDNRWQPCTYAVVAPSFQFIWQASACRQRLVM
jgi:hypothetical protein